MASRTNSPSETLAILVIMNNSEYRKAVYSPARS